MSSTKQNYVKPTAISSGLDPMEGVCFGDEERVTTLIKHIHQCPTDRQTTSGATAWAFGYKKGNLCMLMLKSDRFCCKTVDNKFGKLLEVRGKKLHTMLIPTVNTMNWLGVEVSDNLQIDAIISCAFLKDSKFKDCYLQSDETKLELLTKLRGLTKEIPADAYDTEFPSGGFKENEHGVDNIFRSDECTSELLSYVIHLANKFQVHPLWILETVACMRAELREESGVDKSYMDLCHAFQGPLAPYKGKRSAAFTIFFNSGDMATVDAVNNARKLVHSEVPLCPIAWAKYVDWNTADTEGILADQDMKSLVMAEKAANCECWGPQWLPLARFKELMRSLQEAARNGRPRADKFPKQWLQTVSNICTNAMDTLIHKWGLDLSKMRARCTILPEEGVITSFLADLYPSIWLIYYLNVGQDIGGLIGFNVRDNRFRYSELCDKVMECFLTGGKLPRCEDNSTRVICCHDKYVNDIDDHVAINALKCAGFEVDEVPVWGFEPFKIKNNAFLQQGGKYSAVLITGPITPLVYQLFVTLYEGGHLLDTAPVVLCLNQMQNKSFQGSNAQNKLKTDYPFPDGTRGCLPDGDKVEETTAALVQYWIENNVPVVQGAPKRKKRIFRVVIPSNVPGTKNELNAKREDPSFWGDARFEFTSASDLVENITTTKSGGERKCSDNGLRRSNSCASRS